MEKQADVFHRLVLRWVAVFQHAGQRYGEPVEARAIFWTPLQKFGQADLDVRLGLQEHLREDLKDPRQ
jgi:hypothetical protein